MIHTAHFYILLNVDEVQQLQQRFGVPYTEIGKKVDCQFSAFTTWMVDKYGFRLHFIIDFIKLLGKADIKESDYLQVEKEIKNYLFYLFLDVTMFDRICMVRIDYRLDVKIPDPKHRELLLHLYKKTVEKFRFQKKYDQYDTTIYFNSKSVQGCCYDKEEDVKAEGRIPEIYEKDIFRFEVRLQNPHLNHMKSKKGREKWLEEYFKESLYRHYMSKYLGALLYEGDYYKINKARIRINQSSLTKKEKEQLIEFLKYVSRHGIESAKQKYTRYYFRKFLTQLKALKINPILIPKNRKDFPSFMKNPFCLY